MLRYVKVNWKKFFFCVGLPLLAFYVFIIIIFYAFISTLFLIALLLGIGCMRFSKKKIYPGLSKLALGMMLFFSLMISNYLFWPSQIVRHVDTSLVIQPYHSSVQQLNSTEPGYMWDYLNSTSSGLITPDYFYNTMNDDQRLGNMTNYILDWVIVYYFIPEVYGVIDYVSSTPEAIWHGKGDCHSRTIVMTSYFIFHGYDAWACEAPFHWYTCVFLGASRTDPHFYYRLNWTDPQIMFNHEEVIYTMNVFERLGNVVFGLRFYDKIYELFSIEEVTIGIWPALCGIGLIMTVAIRCTQAEKKRYLKNGILASVILLVGWFLALSFSHILFPQLLFPQLTFITMLISLALAAQSVQSDLGGRLFSKSK